MKILRSFISKKKGNFRVLNPVTTDIQELSRFINEDLKPLASAEDRIQCSLAREVELAVTFAVSKLETAINEALYSALLEKQGKLLELVRLFIVFAKMLRTDKVSQALQGIVVEVAQEYRACKSSILLVVNSTIGNTIGSSSRGDKMGDRGAKNRGAEDGNSSSNSSRSVVDLGQEEVELIIPKFTKLKILSHILQEVRLVHVVQDIMIMPPPSIGQQQADGGYDDGSPESSSSSGNCNNNILEGIADDDIASIQLQYHRKRLLLRVDILGKIRSSLDYAPVFQLMNNFLVLSYLQGVIGGYVA
jgi:hypothetical protein